MRVPKYRKHASGQATVHIRGRDYYLGVYDSPESKALYRRLIAAYVATGDVPIDPTHGFTIRQAVDRFWFAKQLPPKDRHHFKQILGHLVGLYGDRPLKDFGPLAFQAVRKKFVEAGWCRSHCNRQASRVKEFLSWLVAAELYDASKLAAVREVAELRKGQAKESEPREPVCVRAVVRTLRTATRPVRGLILFGLYTGCRPAEACILRPCDVDRQGVAVLPDGQRVTLPGVWVYTPQFHKGSWAERQRYILIGPRLQKQLEEYLRGNPRHYAFKPSEVAKAPRPGPFYQVNSLGHAVAAAAEKAGAEHWSPYQLRHRFARLVRDRFGMEHAREVLGHSPPGVTGVYTGIGLLKAAEAVRVLG